MVTPDTFLSCGLAYAKVRLGAADAEMRFKAHFGTTAHICCMLWNQILSAAGVPPMPNGASYRHLLWGLLLMKIYATEAVLCAIVDTNEKTFRKWAWLMIRRLSRLKHRVVSANQHFYLPIVL